MDADFIAGMTAPIEYDHRALLLDDDDANRMLLSVALQMGALPFSEARSGKEALDLWSPGKFAFAFLDIDLPDIKVLRLGVISARRTRALPLLCAAPTTIRQPWRRHLRLIATCSSLNRLNCIRYSTRSVRLIGLHCAQIHAS